jgi:WASH complex subunit 7
MSPASGRSLSKGAAGRRQGRLLERQCTRGRRDLRVPRVPLGRARAGLEVLEVMRSMDVFAACYAYSLNTQTFIERPAAAREMKHLNTLAIGQVANSVRTHGLGIMNTAVNLAYQFLARKFVGLSQVRDARFYERRLFRSGPGCAFSLLLPFFLEGGVGVM